MWCNAFNSRINVMGRFFTCQGIVMGRFVQLSGSQYQGANKILLKWSHHVRLKCCQIISRNVLRLKSEESLVQIQSTINHKAQIHISCQKQRSFPIISQYHHLDSNQTIRFANLSSWANLFLSSSTHCDNPPNPLPYPWLSPGGDDGGGGDSFKEDMER